RVVGADHHAPRVEHGAYGNLIAAGGRQRDDLRAVRADTARLLVHQLVRAGLGAAALHLRRTATYDAGTGLDVRNHDADAVAGYAGTTHGAGQTNADAAAAVDFHGVEPGLNLEIVELRRNLRAVTDVQRQTDTLCIAYVQAVVLVVVDLVIG